MRSRFPLLLCLAVVITTAFSPARAEDWEQAKWDVMGTLAQVEYLATPNTTDPVPDLKRELKRLNALLSPWVKSSELYEVNRKAATENVQISPEFYHLLQRSLYYYHLTGGAFDITFASVGHLYDYRTGKEPDEKTLEKATKLINASHVKLLPGNRVHFARAGTRIDLGGIAKGYSIDRCIDIIRKHGIRHAWMSLGGDSYVLGKKDGHPWHVGIRHPRKKNATAIMLPVNDIAVSTSGDYERFFMHDGKRIHHIINPKTGHSAGELASVTILTNRSIDADALSTSVFVLGIKKGLALVNRLNGVSAVLIARTGNVYYSDDLEPEGN